MFQDAEAEDIHCDPPPYNELVIRSIREGFADGIITAADREDKKGNGHLHYMIHYNKGRVGGVIPASLLTPAAPMPSADQPPWAWDAIQQKFSSPPTWSRCVEERGHTQVQGYRLGTTMKTNKVKARRKVREPRFCFKTMSDIDVLDDGYKWRKYGQKVVKNTQHPRCYYRCTQDNCRVKKRVERLAEDPRMVITTYEGRHCHSPSIDHVQDNPANSSLSNFFW